MDTFGERLWESMLIEGMLTPGELAKPCQVSRQTATNWLKMREANIAGTRLLPLADCLHIRLRWLISGKGVVSIRSSHDINLERAHALVERLPTARLEEWLAAGERIADE